MPDDALERRRRQVAQNESHFREVNERLDEHEAVRTDSRRFAIVTGRVFPEAGRVVASADR